ncbi:30S ribosomal protein S12 methylthiotransferase RimO [Neolewinella aurantiaca]|uniref:Ribosomal protein uS12 methylthiotransferase RimO n=1 Tax=Neolewinella aurantiaca TaxID=2602767 RepID=A0A5C7FCH4_9BACT|nr:30S ribosomal protein S12 methylthiotransferase RimO [Neolewinella aurantiaca]TXF87832.1 30S ribosomal protein S12 methylthiotransferase RimO [Neolewinella aurantiaca]
MKTKTLRPDKVNVVTLGCSKNLVDSENIITQLMANDYEVEHDGKHDGEDDANVVIVNTCGFIDLAKEESINTILLYADKKGKGEIDKLYVTGCLSQRYKDNLEEGIPEVDDFFGTMELPGLLARLEADYKHELIGERFITTPAHYAYLKISEGCNRTCSFCAIPLMRGDHTSRTIEDLVASAEHLVKNGVKELMLIAQELTYYGLDIYKKRALPELLNALCGVEGLQWIRLHYAYPSKFPRDILDVMAAQPKVCNYLDIPLQHASDEVLKRMRRQVTRAETTDLINYAREVVPGIAIRTTFLVGHPGETEEEFEELCDFVREMRFERLGVFQYSHEEDTIAHDYPDDVPAEVKAERANRLMAIQQDISLELNEEKVGQTLRVIIDRKDNDVYVGRTEFDSPDVDNEVHISAKDVYLRTGDMVNVKIDAATEYDLEGVLVN